MIVSNFLSEKGLLFFGSGRSFSFVGFWGVVLWKEEVVFIWNNEGFKKDGFAGGIDFECCIGYVMGFYLLVLVIMDY